MERKNEVERLWKRVAALEETYQDRREALGREILNLPEDDDVRGDLESSQDSDEDEDDKKREYDALRDLDQRRRWLNRQVQYLTMILDSNVPGWRSGKELEEMVEDLDDQYADLLSDLLGTIDELPEGETRTKLRAWERTHRLVDKEYRAITNLLARREWLEEAIDNLKEQLEVLVPGADTD